MPASEHYFGLPGDITVGVSSNGELPLSPKEELLLGAYLPDVTVLGAAPANIDIHVQHVESSDKTLLGGGDEIEIRDEWKGDFPADLPHLLYSMARAAWLRRGYYPVHAACVGNATFALLPGHSGVGKTTTALTAMSEHDQKLLSGNTTLIRFDNEGAMQAVAGTKTMTLKTEDFERGEFDVIRSITYGNRTAFELKEHQQVHAPREIGKVALVRLGHSMRTWNALPSLSALHTLYPYFLDTEYTDCIVANGNAIYLGDTPVSSRRQLTAKLGQSVLRVPVFSGIGDKEFLAQRIAL
jgi:hypothetical protein